jgi:hypothetical protein
MVKSENDQGAPAADFSTNEVASELRHCARVTSIESVPVRGHWKMEVKGNELLAIGCWQMLILEAVSPLALPSQLSPLR